MKALEGLKALAMPPKSAAPMVEEEEGAGDDPKRTAMLPIAADLIAAVKAGDQGGVADALIAASEAGSAGGGESAVEGEE